METLPVELRNVFIALEATANLRLQDAVTAVGKFLSEQPDASSAVLTAAQRERFVLDLYPDPNREHNYWGTFFRASIFIKEGDNIRSSHDPSFVTPDVLDYWHRRSAEATHPMLRARYADASWDLAALVKDRRPDVLDARTAVDSYVNHSRESKSMFPVVDDLQRALNLALGIGDSERTQKVVDTFFDLHRRTSATGLVGTCFRLFDVLYPLRKKLTLSCDQVDEIIQGLETCLAAWAQAHATSSSPHSILNVAERLTQHYRSIDSAENVQRVVRTAGTATLNICEKAPAMIASIWLQLAHDLYRQHGMKDEMERVLVAIKDKTRESKTQMVSHVVSDSISAEDMERFASALTSGDVHAALASIVREFIPKLAALRNRVADIGERYVAMSLFPITLINDDQPIAHLGSIRDDPEGHVIHQMSEDMKFVSIFLSHGLETFFSRFDLTAEGFVDLLYLSPLFNADRYQLLKSGIRHYREGDYISAVHVLLPQVEQAMRVLLASLNRPTNMQNTKIGAYQEKDLGGILADTKLQNLLGENANKYLRTLLTDQRGWNLRNRVSHGLDGSMAFSRALADRLVHVLMLLSLLRAETEASNDEDHDGIQ